MKVGILRESKVPPDYRVPFSPQQCKYLVDHFSVELAIQPSPIRCFPDADYQNLGLTLCEDLRDCDCLFGIKEIKPELLIPNKTYFIFSHTIKGQASNLPLLQAAIDKKIHLIDYELIKDENGKRLIAFGFFAGIVGAHNALWTYGQRTGTFQMNRMYNYHHYKEAKADYQKIRFPNIKIVLTGSGRVGLGAVKALQDMGIKQVDPEDYLKKTFDFPVFTQLRPLHYVALKSGKSFSNQLFYTQPELFASTFQPYLENSDIFINGIFWNPAAPPFFSLDEMQQRNFHIEVIADISCDIAPKSSIPSTLRPTTIKDPVMGFDPISRKEIPPYQPNGIDIMSIDNLPSELPRDASENFGEQLMEYIIPELLKPQSEMLERATITRNGKKYL